MNDPMASIQKLYDDLSLTLQPEIAELMRAYLAERPQEQFGKHRYNLSSKAVVAEERKVYARYQNYFNVPNEIEGT
jgi:hypothetical protein